MRTRLILIAFSAGFASAPALAQEECPWAGGDYAFSDHGIYGDFTVDAKCTQLEWSRLADGPEVAALKRVDGGWTGALERADFKLLEDGEHLNIRSSGGGAQRRSKVKRKN